MTKNRPNRIYKVTETFRTFEVKASNERDALGQVGRYGYSATCLNCGEHFSKCDCVTVNDEPETFAELVYCRWCEECRGDFSAWHKEQTVTTTYETTKRAQAEAIRQGVTLAMAYLEDINYHTGANALDGLLDALNGVTDLPEWQEETVTETVEFVKAWK